MKRSDFKVGKIYYVELKSRKSSSPVLSIIRIEQRRTYSKFVNMHPGVITYSPIASNVKYSPHIDGTTWAFIPVWEIITAHEILITDLPLYINLFKTPLYSWLLKKGLPHEAQI